MIDILYEDKGLIVVVKPANMPVQKDFSRTEDLQSAVSGYLGKDVFLIHRLDRHVSGPVVLAKTREMSSELNRQMKLKGFSKIYQAVVLSDQPRISDFSSELYYSKEKGMAKVLEPKSVEKLTEKQGKDFKKGLMNVKGLMTREMGSVYLHLLEIELITGRFHQIRAGLSFLGFPIVGDPKYGEVFLDGKKVPFIGL